MTTNNIQTYKPLSIETLTQEQIDLLKNYICKGATKLELQHFFLYANSLQLDPFLKDLYFLKYSSGAPPSIVVGINGFRKVAARSGMHTGTERGITRDADGKLIGAYAKVWRKDWVQPAHNEILIEEYSTGQAMWRKMPASMAMKVAECGALRCAFPELSGVYEEDELSQAKSIKDIEPQGESIKKIIDESMEKSEQQTKEIKS